jgi:hypothetical protein
VNIFALNDNPLIAATQHCDKHVVKMILESAQMLSTAHRVLDGEPERRPSVSGKTMSRYYSLDDYREEILYRAVHMKHPCTLWTMECVDNYKWHYRLFTHLCDEFTYRYGKVHATDRKLRKYLKSFPFRIPITGKRTPFRLAMGSNPECMLEDPIESYRAFYKTKQERFSMTWKKRPTPDWF